MIHLLHWLGLEHSARVIRLVDAHWSPARELSPPIFWSVIIIGILLALINFLPQIGMRTSIRIATSLLRLGMVAIVLILLSGLEYHVTLDLERTQKWVILVDDSASMATADITGSKLTRFAAAKSEALSLIQASDAQVEVEIQTISGAPLGDAPGQGPTHLADAIRRAALSRSQLDGLILMTDGRDSDGRDLQPVGQALKARGVKLYISRYGNNQTPRDTGIFADPQRTVIRLGEPLVIDATIVTDAKADLPVILKEDGKTVKTQTIPADQLSRFLVQHVPAKSGRHTYTLELASSDLLAENNIAVFTADIVEERIKVLLLEGHPRFEFKLFRAVLDVDPLVDLVSVTHLPGGGVYVQGTPLHRNPEQGLINSQADLFKYDIVILRDLPRTLFRQGGDTTETRLLNLVEFVTKRGGGLMVTGGTDVYRAGGYETSHLLPILPFDLTTAISSESQFKGLFFVDIPPPAYSHPILQLLPNPADNRERLNSLRQLDGSNNVGALKPMATPLLTRTVTIERPGADPIDKTTPIMAAMAVGDGKVVATAVDTMWRWQLQPDFDDPPLSMLLANTIRYLAPPPSRRPDQPNVAMTGGSPQVGRDLELTTELRDKNYDPIREADLLVTVTRPDNTTLRIFPRDLPEEPGTYRYRIPLPQPGAYTVDATYGSFTSSRQFLAGAATGELANLAADPDALNRLAKAADALPNDYEGPLVEHNLAPAVMTVRRELEAWNSWPVLLLFILLVSLDCYLRKRQGLV